MLKHVKMVANKFSKKNKKLIKACSQKLGEGGKEDFTIILVRSIRSGWGYCTNYIESAYKKHVLVLLFVKKKDNRK